MKTNKFVSAWAWFRISLGTPIIFFILVWAGLILTWAVSLVAWGWLQKLLKEIIK